MRTHLLLVLGVLAGSASAARAQTPESYRAVQLRQMENERAMVLGLIDSMPERWFRERATPAQRDFGQQIYHAVSAYTHVLPHYAGAPRPTIADTAASFDKSGLRAYSNAVFDWAEAFARSQSAAQREATAPFFDNTSMPTWQIWDELHQHMMWTLGQTVANFRIHGMPPASFLFF